MSLYNLKSRPGGAFLITKFDQDLNVETHYVLVPAGDNPAKLICDCPAAQRPTCRHRIMVPLFIYENKTDTEWFLRYDPVGHSTWECPTTGNEPVAEAPANLPDPEPTLRRI